MVCAALLPILAIRGLKRRTARGRGLAALSLGGLALLARFFRHPGCTTPSQRDLAVAPAYGRVVHVGLEEEPELLGDRRLRISIFLSLFDAHLTRAPVSGRVTYQRYHPGRYLVALHPKSSSLNERNSILLVQPGGTPVLVRQVAGFLARRIRCYTRPGQTVAAGEEIGFITLGSRVDVFLPPDSRPLVQLGQGVRAGETPLARWPSPAGR
ncbi:MAG: phosphatidylserine decarboxylase [Chloroflexi bacterium]|nr:phosphatidylserine decarboxylase [Chloroflexota bacterium]